MTNEELKLISAANIINLRRKKGITQAQLGNILNYSDKTVSKWERGDTIPDAFVLTQIAEYFKVDVDYLLTAHDEWELPVMEDEKETKPNYNVLILVVLLGILTATVTAFVTCWLCGLFEWKILLVGTVCIAVTYLILDVTLRKQRHIKLSLSFLIVSVFVLGYFVFEKQKPWQIFLILVPALILAIAATEIKNRRSTNRRE